MRQVTHCLCGVDVICATDCPLAPWNQDRRTTNRFGFLRRIVTWYKVAKAQPPKIWWHRVESATLRTS